MSAGPGGIGDTDADFLNDLQEFVLGTNPLAADSDGDGFGDLEELARGSSPLFASQVPTNTTPVHIGMTAHAGADGKIHVLVAMYSTVPNPRTIEFAFSAHSNRRTLTFSNSWIASHSTMQVTTGVGGQSLLTLMDIPMQMDSILAAGHVTFFATVRLPGSAAIVSSDAVQLTNVDGIVALIAPLPRPTAPPIGPAPSPTLTIYVPLPAGGPGSVPSSWSEGSVCVQRSTPVAVNGAMVTREVVSAACIEGFDGYCPGSCSSSIGSTYSTVDPIALIGG